MPMAEMKLVLRNTHDVEAQRKFLLSEMENRNGRENEQIKARLDYVNEQLSTIQIWMTLLSEDEAFVIRRHLIEGIDIPRIVVEYCARWGNEFATTERTIKSYHRSAIQKIVCFEQNKRAFL